MVEYVKLTPHSELDDEHTKGVFVGLEVYYESIKREPKIRGIKKCRCDEKLQTKTKEFTRLPYTGLVLELEHLKTGYLAGFRVCARKFMYLLVHENVSGSFETPSC